MPSFHLRMLKKKYFPDRPGVLEKTDPGEDKLTYFYVWPN